MYMKTTHLEMVLSGPLKHDLGDSPTNKKDSQLPLSYYHIMHICQVFLQI
jgi:hypothetical protein